MRVSTILPQEFCAKTKVRLDILLLQYLLGSECVCLTPVSVD